MEAKIGNTTKNLLEVARALNNILADEFVLYTKTRNAHWNVEGPDFHAQHLFFEDQYKKLEDIVDNVAERIRVLGHYAEATMGGFLKLTHLTEQTREKNDSHGFIKELLSDHESIITELREKINPMAEEWHDAGTSDFITNLMEKHEKMAWMLRAHLR